MIFTVQIKVMPLKELLDPQGKAVMGACKILGLNSVEDVRIGKNITLQINADSAGTGKANCRRSKQKITGKPGDGIF